MSSGRGPHLANWTSSEVAAECKAAHAAYRAMKTASYVAYFAAHPELKAANHAYSARDLASALPDGWGELAESLPAGERHRYHLSGNSSQVLALGLLGAASKLDPSLRWLWNALGSLPSPTSTLPRSRFEYVLEPETLREQPRQTSIDYLAEDPSALICVEAKWTEEGIGGCSCAGSGGNPVDGRCTQRVLDRDAYWQVARDVFRLRPRIDGTPCPISLSYEAVRNVAAALALAKQGQQAVFAVIYDQENPYFGGYGDWPGWPAALHATLDHAHSGLSFRSVSWQELTPLLPSDDAVSEWASEKHGLHRTGAAA